MTDRNPNFQSDHHGKSEASGMSPNVPSRDNVKRAAARLASMLDPRTRDRARRRGALEELYVTTNLHTKVDLAVSDFIENIAASMDGMSGKRRALVLVGPSGSGKTTVLQHTLLSRPELQPYWCERSRRWVRPMINFDCPKPVSKKLIARKIMDAAGHPLNTSRMPEYELFEMAKSVLREREVLVVVIDEAQHLLKGNDAKTVQDLSDTLKSLLQIDGWPLHIVLAGVPKLASFLELEPQLRNRSTIVELEQLSYPADGKRVQAIIRGIVEKHAEMTLDPHGSTDEFAHRVILAGDGGFGTIIQLVRSACEMAIREDVERVGLGHFATAYALMSGCSDARNIFISADWRGLSPVTPITELIDRHEQSANKQKARSRNRKNGGE